MPDDWVPQPGYTGGQPVQFLVGHELVEVRMIERSLSNAAAAAESLGARYFFQPVGHADGVYVWGAYDRYAFRRQGGTMTFDPTPLKTFKTNNTDPLLMWGVAKGGQ